MPVNGKQKGAQFERKTCQRLSLWVSGRKREDVFWRSAMSGGRATLQSRKKGVQFEAQSGDISAVHSLGHALLSKFVVECKFYKELDLPMTLYGSSGKIGEWWEELLSQCEKAGDKLPLLIAKENRREELVLTTANGLDFLSGGINLRDEILFSIPRLRIRAIPFRSLISIRNPFNPTIRRRLES